jgi:hypothetical protein
MTSGCIAAKITACRCFVVAANVTRSCADDADLYATAETQDA